MSEQTSRVCVYCKETVTPANDPFHVHGHNECQCGVEPPHNQHLHDADPPLCRTCGQPVKSDRHGYGRHWPDGAETEPRPTLTPERSLAGTATMENRSAGARDASRSELTDSGTKQLRDKWLALADQQIAWSRESDARGDGANSHTERARARIYRECAADLAQIGSGNQPSSAERAPSTGRSEAQE